MPRLTLTDLIDVVTKAGSPKATKVSQLKHRDVYDPATDFYKRFREHVCDIHRSGEGKAALKAVLTGLSDQKKVANYPVVVSGYGKWWGKKNLEWFSPPSKTYTSSGIDVSVNPELGLLINGHPHVIKLHLKTEGLPKSRADLVTSFLSEVLASDAPHGSVFAVLDVRNSKLFVSTPGKVKLKPLIDAELAYIATLWPNL